MKNIGIYKITNPLGRVYIGQSVRLSKRRSAYKNSECVKQKVLYASIIKYGWDNHVFEVIDFCEQEDLNRLEEYYIGYYKSNRCKHPELKGLNLTDGGDGTKGIKRTAKQIEKQHKFPMGHRSWNTGLKSHYVDKLIEANTTRKYVYCYDENGYFIEEYNAIKTASKKLGIARASILSVCDGKTCQAKGYQFRRYKVEKIDELPLKIKRKCYLKNKLKKSMGRQLKMVLGI